MFPLDFAVDTYELMWRCVFTAAGKAGLRAVINPKNGSNNDNNGTLAYDFYIDFVDTVIPTMKDAKGECFFLRSGCC